MTRFASRRLAVVAAGLSVVGVTGCNGGGDGPSTSTAPASSTSAYEHYDDE